MRQASEPSFSIRFLNGRVEVVRRAGEQEHSVPVSLSRMRDLLGNKKEFGYDRLPAGTRYIHENPSTGLTKIILEFPPSVRRIKVQHDIAIRDGKACEIENVPLPGGVFVFDLRKTGTTYSMYNGKMFALAGQIKDLDAPLYRFPMPNLNRADGRICWGNNHVSYPFQNLAAVEGAAISFFQSNFNDHWFYKETLSDSFDWTGIEVRAVEDYFAKLSTLDRFPNDWLRSFGFNLSSQIRS